jgi:hypothetical protein
MFLIICYSTSHRKISYQNWDSTVKHSLHKPAKWTYNRDIVSVSVFHLQCSKHMYFN